jgi:5-methylthioadenosine/S-adenosylhomocysteine deaminase
MLLLARYVLPIAGPHFEDGGVVVRGTDIVAVGTREELLATYPGEDVEDFGLAALMPGFVDPHTHIEYSVFRGAVDDLPYSRWKMAVSAKEANLEREDWRDSALLGTVEALRSGITTVADVTDSAASLGAVELAGLRGVIYREVSTMDKSAVPGELDRALSDMEEWRQIVDGSRVTIGIAPHSPYTCHPALFKGIAEALAGTETHVAIHLAGSRDEYDFVKYGSSPLGQDFRNQVGWESMPWLPTGVSPVRYVAQWGVLDLPNVLGVHCVHVDDDDIDLLTRANVAIAYCPRCNAKLGMGRAPLREFIDHGLRIGVGTDSPASNSTMDYFDEMRVGLLIQRSATGDAEFFTAERFVRMATLGGAQALKLDHIVGSLEAGKRADVIAVDLSASHSAPTDNPYGALVHTSNQDNVLMTMVDGRVLYDRGEFLTLDAEAMKERAREMRLKVRG